MGKFRTVTHLEGVRVEGDSPFGPSPLRGPALDARRAAVFMQVIRAVSRRSDLIDLCRRANVPDREVYEAVGVGTVEALEQLAAQYGLLKPGTQVPK